MSKSYAKQKVKEIAGNLFTKLVDSIDKKDDIDSDERPPKLSPKPSSAAVSSASDTQDAVYGLLAPLGALSIKPHSAGDGGFVGGFHPVYSPSGNLAAPPLCHASSAPPPVMPYPSIPSPPQQQSLTMQMALRPDTSIGPVRPSSAPITTFSKSDLDEIRPILSSISKPTGTKPSTPQRPSKVQATSPSNSSTLQRPVKLQTTSSSGSSAPSTPSRKEGKELQIQCAGTTKAGKRCTRMVKAAPALSQKIEDESENDSDVPLERFCFQHTKELLGSSGCYARKNGEWVNFNDWIPGYLQTETQLSLRIEMERARSPSDVDGYIYTFEIREDENQVIKLKVGRAVNLVKRIDQWGKQCGSKEQVLRGFYPNPEDDHNAQTTLMKGRVKAGTPVPCCHRLERLIHLELADLSATQVYLDPEWPAIEFIDTSSQAPAGKKNGTKAERCLDCGSMHKEIFEFRRWTSGANKNKEWEKVVKPVIERWGKFVELYV